MGIGLVSIQTSQKKKQSGAPFASDAAENGLSVDTVTGRIVLGNNAGAVGNPAQLLNTREIFGNGFNIRQRDSASEFTDYNGGSISIRQLNTRFDVTPPNFSMAATGGVLQPLFTLDDGTQTFDTSLNGAGVAVYAASGTQIGSIDLANGRWQFGPVIAFNTATVQVNGTLTNKLLVSPQATGTINLVAANDTGILFTNAGAAGTRTFVIPQIDAAAVGTHYLFCVQQAVNLVVQCNAADTMNLGGSVSSAGGTLTSSTIGSFLHLHAVAANQIIAENYPGVWVIA